MASTKSCPSRSASVRTPAKPTALSARVIGSAAGAFEPTPKSADRPRLGDPSMTRQRPPGRSDAMCLGERRRHPVDVGLAKGVAHEHEIEASRIHADRRQRCRLRLDQRAFLLRNEVGAGAAVPRLVDRQRPPGQAGSRADRGDQPGVAAAHDEHAIAELGRSHPDAERRQRSSLTEGRQDLEQHRSRFALPSDDIVLPREKPSENRRTQGKAGCPARRNGRGQHDHDCRCAWRCAKGWRSRSAR